jgi:hypothetical protein
MAREARPYARVRVLFPACPTCARARTHPLRTQVLALDWADIFIDPDGDAFAVLEGGPSGLASNGVLAVGSAARQVVKFTPGFGSTNAKFSIKATDLKGAESAITQVTLTFGERLGCGLNTDPIRMK